VRFDGYFCDPVELGRTVDVARGSDPAIDSGRAKFWGRRCCEHKELLVPVGLVRDINDEPPQPLLSILNLRPMDYLSGGTRQSDFNLTCDGYIEDVVHGPCSAREQCPGEYEVRSVFVKETPNVEQLNAGELRSRLKGRNVVGWYLQWPMCQGGGFTWGNGGVRKQAFFDFCVRAERAGIRTCWPHESHVYELMAGKLWVPQMSLNKDYKVPASARVHYADFRRSPQRAARRALDQMNHVRQVVWDQEPVPLESFKGVVKFGFSWCGTDVTPFVGIEALEKAFGSMFSKAGCEQTHILVQEMIPNVIGEYRCLCFHDRHAGGYHKERLWVAQTKGKFNINVEGFSGMASSTVMPSDIVARNCLDGDFEALHAAESEAEDLCDRWLRWMLRESPEPLQCTRIDFLVAKGAAPGQASVWTCEVGECGGSLCSVEVHGRNTAALNNAIRDDPSGRFPAPLHRPLPRHNGVKSM